VRSYLDKNLNVYLQTCVFPTQVDWTVTIIVQTSILTQFCRCNSTH